MSGILRGRPTPPGWRPQLVALDIDGTVMEPDGVVTAAVHEAVRRAAAAGAHVVLATGRSLPAALPVAKELGLTSGWVVVSNGGVTATLDPAEVVDVRTFDAGPVVRMLREHVPEALVAVEDADAGYRVTAPFPEGELGADEQRVVPSLDELVAEPVVRVVMRCPDERAERFLRLVEQVGLKDVSYAVGYTAWLDIAPQGVSKASALERVRRHVGVAAHATAAVGDGRNDLEMLRWARCGVAMGHAPAEVQDAARAVTLDIHQDGLAHALDWWFPAPDRTRP